MRKIIIILLVLVIYGTTLNAQIPVATKKQIHDFFKSTTMVVLEDGMFSDYNSEIEPAMKKYWKVTPYKVISMSEMDDYKYSNKYSFLMKAKIRYDAKKATDVEYEFLTLMLGNVNSKVISNMPDLCSFPLSYDKDDASKYLFKLASALQFIQNHVKLTRDDASLSDQNIIKYYNKNKTAFNDKELYVLKSDLSTEVNSISKIKKVYPGKVKIVSVDELKKAIEEQKEGVVYLHKVGPTMKSSKARCWKLVLSTADAQLFYFDHHKISKKTPDGILKTDFKSFKKMNK